MLTFPNAAGQILAAIGPSIVPLGVHKVHFDLGAIRLSFASTALGVQVFIGIGPRAAMDKYLPGVHASKSTGTETSAFKVSYDDVPRPAVPNPPTEQGFWAESASGAGTQQITMDLRSGVWVVVIMNANANANAEASVNPQAGFHSELFGAFTAASLIGGIASLILGAGLIVIRASGLVGRRVPSSTLGHRGDKLQNPLIRASCPQRSPPTSWQGRRRFSPTGLCRRDTILQDCPDNWTHSCLAGCGSPSLSPRLLLDSQFSSQAVTRGLYSTSPSAS